LWQGRRLHQADVEAGIGHEGVDPTLGGVEGFGHGLARTPPQGIAPPCGYPAEEDGEHD
jgi:hypothetical protein